MKGEIEIFKFLIYQDLKGGRGMEVRKFCGVEGFISFGFSDAKIIYLKLSERL